LPVGGTIRPGHIIIGSDHHIQAVAVAHVKSPADGEAQRHGPGVVGVGFPVRADHSVVGHVRTRDGFEIVKQHGLDHGGVEITIKRPEVAHNTGEGDILCYIAHDDSGSASTPIGPPKVTIGMGGKRKLRTNAPFPIAFGMGC